jgi:hypothetical protein
MDTALPTRATNPKVTMAVLATSGGSRSRRMPSTSAKSPAARSTAAWAAAACSPLAARKSALQLAVNLGCIVVAGTLILATQGRVSDRQRARQVALG